DRSRWPTRRWTAVERRRARGRTVARSDDRRIPAGDRAGRARRRRRRSVSAGDAPLLRLPAHEPQPPRPAARRRTLSGRDHRGLRSADWGLQSPELAGLIAQRGRSHLVLVARRGFLDLRARLVQLCLCELDDRAEAQTIAAVGELERV